MVVDTSAVLAVLFAEDDADRFVRAIAATPVRLMSAGNYLEAAIVIDRQRGLQAGRQFDTFIRRSQIQVEPVTIALADIARQAYLDYGKGIHPAKLNFGDCFSYALSKLTGLPLLYKGDDFSRTDIVAAI